jgi:hypothetical protein
MDYKGLRALLVVHGFITMAAGIVLTVAPGLIPSAVGIRLDPSAHVVAYLLAGADNQQERPDRGDVCDMEKDRQGY